MNTSTGQNGGSGTATMGPTTTPMQENYTVNTASTTLENASQISDLFTFVAGVQNTQLVSQLQSANEYTIFAPANEAFNELTTSTIEALIGQENRQNLTSLIAFHVVPGSVRMSDLTEGKTLRTVNGQTVTVSKSGDTVMIGGATIRSGELASRNGVLYVVDTVLFPDNFRTSTSTGRR